MRFSGRLGLELTVRFAFRTIRATDSENIRRFRSLRVELAAVFDDKRTGCRPCATRRKTARLAVSLPHQLSRVEEDLDARNLALLEVIGDAASVGRARGRRARPWRFAQDLALDGSERLPRPGGRRR
jgi:hypothetical protein